MLYTNMVYFTLRNMVVNVHPAVPGNFDYLTGDKPRSSSKKLQRNPPLTVTPQHKIQNLRGLDGPANPALTGKLIFQRERSPWSTK